MKKRSTNLRHISFSIFSYITLFFSTELQFNLLQGRMLFNSEAVKQKLLLHCKLQRHTFVSIFPSKNVKTIVYAAMKCVILPQIQRHLKTLVCRKDSFILVKICLKYFYNTCQRIPNWTYLCSNTASICMLIPETKGGYKKYLSLFCSK